MLYIPSGMFFHIGGVDVNNNWEQVSEQDYKVIIEQLGREPRGVLGIACRCEFGYPCVIVNRPINTEIETVTVFPTTFWLTCPHLKKAVSQLESSGMISEMETKIAQEKQFAEAVRENHLSHAEIRQSLVPNEVKQVLAKNYPKEFQVLVKTGVGGIRSQSGVKCLHAHLADFLVDGNNVIGQIVYDSLKGDISCSSINCAVEN